MTNYALQRNLTAKKSDSYVLPLKRNVCVEKECAPAATSKHKEPKEAVASRKQVSPADKDARILGLKNTVKTLLLSKKLMRFSGRNPLRKRHCSSKPSSHSKLRY